MRGRVLCAGLVALAALIVAGPASAKVEITQASIGGPGLDGKLRILPPDTHGLWRSGIDVAGGLDDVRAESLEELGVTPRDLGPKYLVTYRFGHGRGANSLIRQDLYPYASVGPVTYTRPDQEITAGLEMSFTAGWYKSSEPCRLCGVRPPSPQKAAADFFRYLVRQGLPKPDPVASGHDDRTSCSSYDPIALLLG